MISKFSKYAKIFALALTLLIAAPLAISAAPSGSGEVSPNAVGQNTNKAFNGGGSSSHHRRRRAVRRRRRRH